MPDLRSWDQILDDAGVSTKDREYAKKEASKIIASMKLAELRRARALTQEQIAEQMGVSQGNISEIERRTDLYLSTLARFIHACGGTFGRARDGVSRSGDLDPPLRSIRRASAVRLIASISADTANALFLFRSPLAVRRSARS